MQDNTKLIAEEIANVITQFWHIGKPYQASKKIKPSELMLLGFMIHHFSLEKEGVKVSDLSYKMGITPAAVTHTINSLEGGGYVERIADPADRRIVLVRPTKKGKHAIEAANAKRLERLTGLVSFLGEEDSKELIRLLSLTLNYIKERGSQSGEQSET